MQQLEQVEVKPILGNNLEELERTKLIVKLKKSKATYLLTRKPKGKTWRVHKPITQKEHLDKITTYLSENNLPIGISRWIKRTYGAFETILNLKDNHPLTDNIFILSSDLELYPELDETKDYFSEIFSKENTTPLKEKIGYGSPMRINLSLIPDREYELILERERTRERERQNRQQLKRKNTPKKVKAELVILE